MCDGGQHGTVFDVNWNLTRYGADRSEALKVIARDCLPFALKHGCCGLVYELFDYKMIPRPGEAVSRLVSDFVKEHRQENGAELMQR